jgi:hypothetical protein
MPGVASAHMSGRRSAIQRGRGTGARNHRRSRPSERTCAARCGTATRRQHRRTGGAAGLAGPAADGRSRGQSHSCRHMDGRAARDGGAAASVRRLSALLSFYRYCAAGVLAGRLPTDGVARPAVDPDYTTTAVLDRNQARAMVAAAGADTGAQAIQHAQQSRLGGVVPYTRPHRAFGSTFPQVRTVQGNGLRSRERNGRPCEREALGQVTAEPG